MPTETLPLDRMTEDARTFADLCERHSVNGVMPKRLFRPEEIGTRLLPNIVIMEYQPPDRLYVRLAGTSICANYGREITGWEIGDLVTGEEAGVTRALHLQGLQGAGVTAHLVYNRLSGADLAYERLMQPLIDDQGNARWLGMWMRLTVGLHLTTIRKLGETFAEPPSRVQEPGVRWS
jgi:hypothetical protein